MPVKSMDMAQVCKLTKNIYSVICDQENSDCGANQGFVVLEDSVLVFDTGSSVIQARTLDNSISQVTANKIKYIVNSHNHASHVSGNYFFSKKYSRHGLNIISHENCVRRLNSPNKSKDYKKSGKNPSSTEIVVPNVVYSGGGMNLKIEEFEFVFVHPELGAHTFGDTVLAIPESGVMFLGDVLYNSYFPYVGEANIEAWIDFLKDIDFNTYTKFVPGHGRVCGINEVLCFTNYLREIGDRLLSVDIKPNRKELRSCFEIDGTEDWKSRFTIDRNVDALLGKFLPRRKQPQK